MIDASNAPALAAKALELVEPGERVVYVGLARGPSLLDAGRLALRRGQRAQRLGGLEGAIQADASGAVDPGL